MTTRARHLSRIPLSGNQLIAGVDSRQGTDSFLATHGSNPQNLETNFYEATDEEIDQAAQAAYKAFAQWKTTSPDLRAQFLSNLAHHLEANREPLLQRTQLETAYPPPRLAAEFNRALAQLRLFANLIQDGNWTQPRIDLKDPTRQPIPKPDTRRMLQPIGPVGVLGACNFPLAISVVGNDSVAAWAAGCPVVVKAHPGHPGTCELLGRCVQHVIQDLGLPNGIFSLLQGKEHRVAINLVAHPRLRAIGFTGSLTGGTALWQVAQQRPEPIPFFAEMGSPNPVFIFPSALTERPDAISQGLLQSLSFGHGQMCTRPGIVLVVDSPASRHWLDSLASKAAELPAQPLLTPDVAAHFQRQLSELQQRPGVTSCTTPSNNQPYHHHLQILKFSRLDAQRTPAVWDTEIFGPATLVITCEDTHAMLQLATQIPGGLTASLQVGSNPENEATQLANQLADRVGRVVWNGFPTGVEIGYATQHGGPYPASFDSQGTSIGTASIQRFARPVCYQNWPDNLLPDELQDANPRNLWRCVNGSLTKDPTNAE